MACCLMPPSHFLNQCWLIHPDDVDIHPSHMCSVIFSATHLSWIQDIFCSFTFKEMKYLPMYPIKHVEYYFYPRPIWAFGYCCCLCLSVYSSVYVYINHELLHMITPHLLKLGSPNFGPCMVKILIILGDDWPLPSRSNWIKLKSSNSELD